MSDRTVTIEDIREVLVDAISRELGIPSAELPTDRPFAEIGMDSFAALTVAMDLEDAFGLVKLPPTLLWDCPTVDALVPALFDIAISQSTPSIAEGR